jgi:uncharacterized protein YuzE
LVGIDDNGKIIGIEEENLADKVRIFPWLRESTVA